MRIQFRAVDLALARFGFNHNGTYTACDEECQPLQTIFLFTKIWVRCPNTKYGWYPAKPHEIEVAA